MHFAATLRVKLFSSAAVHRTLRNYQPCAQAVAHTPDPTLMLLARVASPSPSLYAAMGFLARQAGPRCSRLTPGSARPGPGPTRTRIRDVVARALMHEGRNVLLPSCAGGARRARPEPLLRRTAAAPRPLGGPQYWQSTIKFEAIPVRLKFNIVPPCDLESHFVK